MRREEIDEVLELCMVLGEKSGDDKVSRDSVKNEFMVHNPCLIEDKDNLNVDAVIGAALEQGLIVEDRSYIKFTSDGKKRAEGIVRRHRLAEKLFTDILELPYAHSEPAACKFEHILSEEVTDSVCAFLGHPPTCPHGKAIPRGNCCRLFITEIAPIVVPLSQLSPGEEGKIVFISSLHPNRLQRLSSFGVVPGNRITLSQKNPSFVIKLNETQVALDKEIVSEIYVRRGTY